MVRALGRADSASERVMRRESAAAAAKRNTETFRVVVAESVQYGVV
jgi:hypothetical protein